MMNGGRAAPNVDALPSPSPPANGKPATGKPAAAHLNTNRDARKPLFTHAASKENSTKSGSRHADCKKSPADAPRRRPASSSSPRPASAMSTKSDRSTSATPRAGVPKANSTGPKHSRSGGIFTLNDAFKIAVEEDEEKGLARSPGAIDASPSPAPRSWSRNNSIESPSARGKQQRAAKDAPSRTPRSRNSAPSAIPRPPSSLASQSSPSTPSSPAGRKKYDFGKKLPTTNLFGKGRTAPKTGEVLARKASNSSLDGRATSPAPNRGAKARTAPTKPAGKENDLPGVRPSPVEPDVPVPSIESNQDARLSSSWDIVESPNKSYAWQVDDEFTAGDLQVSDSPRIRFDADTNKPMRPVNTKLDDIMEREDRDFKDHPLPEGVRPRPFNSRLDEIEGLENRIDDYTKTDQDKPRNSKLDDIWSLERDLLSRKAIATSRLAAIQASNSQARPRSASPVPYRPSGEFTRDSTRYYDAESSSENGEDWVEGERIPHTPVTVFRKNRNERPRDSMILRASSDTEDYGASDRPRDALRRLARASSTSPEADVTSRRSDGRQAHKHDPNPKQAAAPANPHPKPPSSPSLKEPSQRSSPEKASKNGKGNPKPSVGFVGLRRVSSSESTRTKRSSMAHSDGDPTERIEREMMLFAPADNQSDRGSIRVPSPDTSEDECEERQVGDLKKKGEDKAEDKAEDRPEAGDLEETPRPKRQQNILSMPTPQVTGAYVETPATVKAEPASVAPEKAPAASTAVPDKPNVVRRRRSYSASDKSDKEESDRDNPMTKARAERSHRRTRSLPKHRQPLLNTAKPPTVRDDLMELQRTHNIEDSTLDDFGELLASKDVPDSPEIDEMLEDITDKFLDEVAKEQEGGSTKEPKLNNETELLTRMTKTLETGLLGIRSAKQGIERLEDQVSHADPELLRRAKEKVERKMRKEIKQEEGEEVATEVKVEKAEDVAPVKREVKEKPAKPVDTKPERQVTKPVKAPAQETAPTYVSIPLPRLYRRSPLRLTFLGLLVIAAALYFAAESAVCSRYCRPTTCTTGPCVWSLDDPTFGYAIPHKVDDWTTGGQARTLTARLAEELSDLSADALDYVRGTDIRDVNLEDLAFEDRRKHRRRLGKKGLAAERVEPAEHRAKWDAWRTERAARERASAAREMGYYDYGGESESMSDDVRV